MSSLNLLDKILGFFSPSLLARRTADRIRTDYLAQHVFGAYAGAKSNRILNNWITTAGSPDSDLLSDLPKLRERSRDLIRDDANARGIVNRFQTNVIGSGIRPQSRFKGEEIGYSENETAEIVDDMEDIWKDWIPNADASERLDFYQIQNQVYRQVLENGEAFILILRLDRPNIDYKLALKVIEADRIETPPEESKNPNIRSGIEIGEFGQTIAYHVRKDFPGETKLGSKVEYIRYPAKDEDGRPNMLHLYTQDRPDQTRGTPLLTAILPLFKIFGDYVQAELIAAKIGACFGLVIQKNDPSGAALNDTLSAAGADQRLNNIEPGMISYLAPGETMSQISPTHPGNTFETFTIRILKQMGACLGLPYELIAMDFSQSNFSNTRAGLLEARRFLRNIQEWVSKELCRPVWNLLLEEAYLNKTLDVKDFYSFQKEYTEVRFLGQGWTWVDPAKEITASVKALDNNITTLAEVVSQNGNDWEDILEQRSREEKKRQKLGLVTKEELAITNQDLSEQIKNAQDED